MSQAWGAISRPQHGVGTASLLHKAVVRSQHGPSGQFPHMHAVLQRTSVKVSHQWSYSTKRRETYHDHTSLAAMHVASYLPVSETGGHPACPLSSGQFPAGRERGPLSSNMQTSTYWSAGWARKNRRSCPKIMRHAPYLALLLTPHAKPAWKEPRQPPCKANLCPGNWARGALTVPFPFNCAVQTAGIWLGSTLLTFPSIYHIPM